MMHGEGDSSIDNGLQESEGQEMNSQLYSLLNEGRGVLVSEAVNRLKNSSADHYRNTDVSDLCSKCNKLIQAFSLAVKEEQKEFTEYVWKIGKDRIRKGYDLEEMQYALNTIEDLLWMLCIEKVADDIDKLEDLQLVAHLIGAAKDRLAQQYLEALQDAVAAATPIWRKEQAAEVLTLRDFEEGLSKGSADQVQN